MREREIERGREGKRREREGLRERERETIKMTNKIKTKKNVRYEWRSRQKLRS